jgi:uncharacterized protein YukE
MSLLDAQTPAIFSASASFTDQSAMMRGALNAAESTAMQAQAFHVGESATAFQAAHARFIEATAKINALLDIASANQNEAGSTYTAADAEGAEGYNSVPTVDVPIRA